MTSRSDELPVPKSPASSAAAAVTIAGARGIRGGFLRLAANLSYAFYLWQYAVIITLGPVVAPATFVAIAFLAVVGVAALSWLVLESPVMRRASPGAIPAATPTATTPTLASAATRRADRGRSAVAGFMLGS